MPQTDLQQELQEARAKRELAELDKVLDQAVKILLSHADESGHARGKLRHLLSYYAKKAKPFTACVADNMKRFGPGRTEKVCATLKDMIRGTHNWRKGASAVHASAEELDEDPPEIDEEMEKLLLSIPDSDIDRAQAVLFSA